MRAQARRLRLDKLNAIMVVEVSTQNRAHALRRMNALAKEWQGLAGEHLGVPTLLLAAADVPAAAKEVHGRLKSGLHTGLLVVAAELTASEPLGRAFTLARRCAQILVQLGSTDRWATTRDLAMYAMAFDPDRAQDLSRFVNDALAPLADYDARRNSELVKTLAEFFENSGNLTRTAAALHVHANTLLKRLDRIGQFLGPDWQAPDNSLRLHLAVRLRRLALHLDTSQS